MTSALLLLLALMLDAGLGEPRWLWDRLPHPAVVMGRFVGWADERFNDRQRLTGVAVLVMLTVAAWIVGSVLAALGPIVEILVAAMLLAHRSLIDHVALVANELRLSLASGRAAVARIVSRDTGEMAEPDVVRAALESAAENLSDGVIGPAFWFLVAGLPGMVVYKMVNTADSMIGYRTARHENFGWAAARLDDVLNWIPARLTALLLWAAGRGWDRARDFRSVFAEARRHKSPNAGWPEAILARSVDVALAGPRRYHGTLTDLPWVNPEGRKTPGPAEIDAGLRQLWYAWVIFAMVVLSLSFFP